MKAITLGRRITVPRMGLPEARQVRAGAGNTKIELDFFANGLEVTYAESGESSINS